MRGKREQKKGAKYRGQERREEERTRGAATGLSRIARIEVTISCGMKYLGTVAAGLRGESITHDGI